MSETDKKWLIVPQALAAVLLTLAGLSGLISWIVLTDLPQVALILNQWSLFELFLAVGLVLIVVLVERLIPWIEVQ